MDLIKNAHHGLKESALHAHHVHTWMKLANAKKLALIAIPTALQLETVQAVTQVSHFLKGNAQFLPLKQVARNMILKGNALSVQKEAI